MERIQSRLSKGLIALLVVCIAGMWGGNYYYYYAHKLEGAVLLNHYYEAPIIPGETLDFYYITHRSSSREVVALRLSGELYWHTKYQSERGEFGPYTLKAATIQIGHPEVPLPEQAYERFQSIEVWFNDGVHEVLPIGDIQLLPYTQPARVAIEETFGSSNSNGEHRSTFRALEDLSIVSVQTTLDNQISDVLDFEFLSSPPEYTRVEQAIQAGLPIELKQGNGISLNYTFRIPEQDPRSFDIYRGKLQLLLQLADGEQATWDFTLNTYPQPTQEAIMQLIEEREEARHHENQLP
ncbi:hypothetical protein [Paenibacillus daejeonensis]|uniref:hypothetical protein n=1 Tax=Paenibacillus daejeonensis TaxID=135193 RepID=UPI00037D71DB|nr:hypothetical protein [Paenibacillus daejeonensis]